MKVQKKRNNEIDINNYNQVRNAAMSMRVSEDQLLEAIKKVGPVIDDLTQHLKAYHNPFVRARGWHM